MQTTSEGGAEVECHLLLLFRKRQSSRMSPLFPVIVVPEAPGAALSRGISQTGTNHGERGRFRLTLAVRLGTITA